MKNKKLALTIVFSILGIILIIFLIHSCSSKSGGNGLNTGTPVKINYPEVADDALYQDRLFDSNYIHEVDIKISNSDWQDLLDNALAKKKYTVDVVIDGVKIKDVAFRTKGNSSLKNIAQGPGGGAASNRYSFKIFFGKYVKDQSYYGLDVLNLNNIFGDASYINDYVSYEVFRQMGIPAPLTSFVYLKINGQNAGVYAAVEEVSDSFFTRNNLTGNLYKPGQSSGQVRGSSLLYTDDDYNNYIDIFNNVEGIATDEDKDRVIEAIKNLNNQTNLEQYLDTDEIIRYFVAHNYLLSYDSYTGKSIHNYYLVENEGKLSILPWDYNLAFGRFNVQGDATTIINYGIDSPLSMAEEKDRPLWKWIMDNKEYKEKYHKYMEELLEKFFDSGELDKLINNIYLVIKDYVNQDVSAFYSPQQVAIAVTKLKEFCKLRTESIHKQLDGELSTINDKQKDSDKVDASKFNLNDLGFIADDSKRQEQTKSSDSESHSKKSHQETE